MNTLLLGGTGFLGSALAASIVRRGDGVISVSRTPGKATSDIRHVSIDLASGRLSPLLASTTDTAIILFGQIGPQFNEQKELATLERVLYVLAATNQHVLFCSTTLVYGNCTTPADEQTACRPIGEYPTFKLAAEAMVRRHIPEQRHSILRLSNIYGSPQNRGFIGHVVQALKSNDPKPLVLNANGLIMRDYIFIDDVVQAILGIMDASSGSGTINVATGTSSSLQMVVDQLSLVSGKQIPYTLSNELPDEAISILISPQRLRQQLPTLSYVQLNDGLRQTLQRYKEELP